MDKWYEEKKLFLCKRARKSAIVARRFYVLGRIQFVYCSSWPRRRSTFHQVYFMSARIGARRQYRLPRICSNCSANTLLIIFVIMNDKLTWETISILSSKNVSDTNSNNSWFLENSILFYFESFFSGKNYHVDLFDLEMVGFYFL